MNLLTIFVFVLIIVLAYTVYKLMTKTTATVSGFSDASKTLTVSSDKTGSNGGANNYGYSVWLYIDTWISSDASTTTFNKNVLTRCDAGNNPLFTMYLDNNQNNLNVVLRGNETAPCTIRNVQLQKWINLTMSVYGNTVDLYLDGKLVRTCIMKTLPASLKSGENVYVGGGYTMAAPPAAPAITPQDGNLQGYLSNVVYKAEYFTPEEAWSIYSDGYSGAGMFDFLHSYKLNFSLTNNNQTVGQFSI
jgi:hypothetical protein